jgi:hypothetical protein
LLSMAVLNSARSSINILGSKPYSFFIRNLNSVFNSDIRLPLLLKIAFPL